jgi:predicted RNA-binding protein with PIN domain
MARRLIIDGYNLLRSASRYAPEVERDIDAARERLIADVGARATEGQKVTIVFDGGNNPHSDGEARPVGGVDVIFSPAGTDADTVIESLAAAAREAGDETEVVTSDGATRWASVGGPVIVTRASTFARELDADETAWREHRDVAAKGKATVSDRIDGGVRDRLDGLAGRRRSAGR